eukprot:1967039-Amphidinium_carterae.1
MIAGDLDKLPAASQWHNLVMEEGEVATWSSQDLKCCFYLFELPPCWRPFFVFSKQVPGWRVGWPERDMVYVTSR